MAEKRKLLAEIDKVFRKVDEGVELFEEIMGKMSEANSDNQRDKLQDDLKKEIKKLQRLRDQIKGWQNSNEIKDKDKLTNYRKVIEARMEQFKDIERENKTKPHSKQGLLTEDKMDPKEKEKSDTNCLHKLSEQIDVFECEIEGIVTAGGKKVKKGDKEKLDDMRHRLERHKFHSQKLELIMRLVNNDTIDSENITEEFKETMDNYIDDYMSDDGLPDADWLYDDLHLGDLNDIAQQLGNVTNIGTLEEAENLEDGVEGAANAEAKDGEATDDVLGVSAPARIGMKARHTSGETADPSIPHSLARASAPGMCPRSTPVTPLKLTAQISLDSVPPAVVGVVPQRPVTPVAPTLPYNSVAASGVQRATAKPSVPMTIPMTPTSVSPTAAPPPPPLLASYSSMTAHPIKEQQQSAPMKVAAATHRVSLADSSPSNSLNLSSLSSALDPIAPINNATTSSNTTSATSPQSRSANTPATPNAVTDTQSNVASLAAMAQQVINVSPQESTLPLSTPPATALNDTQASALALLTAQQKHNATTTQGPQQAHIPPSLGASPLGRQQISDEQQQQLAALESAMNHMPMSIDSERVRHMPKSPCPTPAYYPQTPPPMADTYEYYAQLTPETLFFIFYYLEGTRAQYLAAKALKSKSWRFHKKHLMWFQRYEEPKVINDDYEQGAYIYFDYALWMQKKKEGFTFEYKYLEDRDL